MITIVHRTGVQFEHKVSFQCAMECGTGVRVIRTWALGSLDFVLFEYQAYRRNAPRIVHTVWTAEITKGVIPIFAVEQ